MYALGLVVIAAVYVGFAVADGRPKIIAAAKHRLVHALFGILLSGLAFYAGLQLATPGCSSPSRGRSGPSASAAPTRR